MVARIRSGKSLKGAINYNEKKVKGGKAELISANGYSKEINALNFHDKLNRVQKLAELNTRTETHCLHVSLNFDVTEILSPEKLQLIAEAYMKGIGFGNQPYLVYQHHDAAHQHIHIVSTNIQKDGKRISLHNLGKIQSEKTRQEIEVKFGLIKASDRQQKQLQPLRAVNLEKAVYGKMETKRAISNIVTQVIAQYKFASIPELNAVLSQYNVTADRGAEETRMFQNKGLQYSLIDERGNKIGIPIKASSIYGKPTLKSLESKYENNKNAKQAYKTNLKSILIDTVKVSSDAKSFSQQLKAKGIAVVFRRNDKGFIYGLTYVDHNSKCVFNGSELGKEFSAAMLREKWESTTSGSGGNERKLPAGNPSSETQVTTANENDSELLQELTRSSSGAGNQLPYPFRKKRKRKNRKL